MPVISVIVPVYNAEKYLHRCIDSILAQTFTDFELLLINDGSKDNSGTICDEYAEKDPRVRVFHKENGGVSSARNVGLDNAQGEWVTFVDSDDWVNIYFLYNFINSKNISDFEIYIGGSFSFNKLGDKSIEKNYGEGYFSINVAIKTLEIHRYADLHGKIFKRQIIIDSLIKFNCKINYAEDGLFFDNYLLQVHSVYVTNKESYYYEKHEGGLSTIINSFTTEEICFCEYIDIVQKLSRHSKHPIDPNPGIAYRYILSGYRDLNKNEFIKKLKNQDLYYRKKLAEGCKLLRTGDILSYTLNHKIYIIFYILLLLAFPKTSYRKLFYGTK